MGDKEGHRWDEYGFSGDKQYFHSNPFVVLGVCTSASTKDIEANKSKMTVLLKLNKSILFPNDAILRHPTISRDQNLIDEASRSISQPVKKIQHAMFWFHGLDADMLDLLTKGGWGLKIAKNELDKPTDSYSILINRAIFALLDADYAGYVRAMSIVINKLNFCEQFVASVCGDNFKISREEVSHLLIDKLLTDFPNEDWKKIFEDNSCNPNDTKYIIEKSSRNIRQQLSDIIEEVALISKEDGEARYQGALKLKEGGLPILKNLESQVGKDSLTYSSIADKFAQEILACAFDYYNKAHDRVFECTQQCYELNKLAFEIAVNVSVKNKLAESLKEIKRRLDSMETSEEKDLMNRVTGIANSLMFPSAKAETALSAVQNSAPLLLKLKELLGKKDQKYIKLSTDLASIALSVAIKDLNLNIALSNKIIQNQRSLMERAPFAAITSECYAVLSACWSLILNLEELDLTQQFISNRLLPNKNTIDSNFRNLNVTFPHVVIIDMRTDSDIFEECCTIQDFQTYLAKYPKGRHSKEANHRIEELVSSEDDYWTACLKHKEYESYLRRYPNGKHVAEAKKLINLKWPNRIKSIWQSMKSVVIWIGIVLALIVIFVCIWRFGFYATIGGIFLILMPFLIVLGLIDKFKEMS